MVHLLGRQGLAAEKGLPELNGGLHHRAKVKRVIQLFMNGGVSQMDSFDYKPELIKRHGQKFEVPGQRVGCGDSGARHSIVESQDPDPSTIKNVMHRSVIDGIGWRSGVSIELHF
jgi:hypothetical protein